jgi:hypothetical protein
MVAVALGGICEMLLAIDHFSWSVFNKAYNEQNRVTNKDIQQ